jgi:hypothetical protein
MYTQPHTRASAPTTAKSLIQEVLHCAEAQLATLRDAPAPAQFLLPPGHCAEWPPPERGTSIRRPAAATAPVLFRSH